MTARDAEPFYHASLINRSRATKAEVEHRRWALFAIIEDMHPMTVRQVYYQATVRGLVEKTEAGYAKVQTDLVVMRKSGMLPYGWLADNTRWQRKPRTWSSVQQALEDAARIYRKSLWDDADAYVAIWLEKDALAGVVLPVTASYDTPLMVARGYASLSFLHRRMSLCAPEEPNSTPSGTITAARPPVRSSRRKRATKSSSVFFVLTIFRRSFAVVS